MPESELARRYCGTAEAARRWGCTKPVVIRRINRGQIPAQWVGGIWLIPREVVEEMARKERSE